MKQNEITYHPWSNTVLKECLSAHDNGKMPTLDLELTAKCTKASCIYCDSRPDVGDRHINELNLRETKKLLEEAKSLGLKWIYTCGLGEPIEDVKFRRLIETASELGVRISLFTNGLLIDRTTAKWLYGNRVCLILKLDSFKEETFDKILGKRGAAKKIYDCLDLLLESGYAQHSKNKHTDLAFSIVPTHLNLNEIEDVITFAKTNNIFPSIGELEQAGRALENSIYKDLSLSQHEIQNLKNTVESLLWKGYTRPICPTIITGIHIDNVGRCIVDSETGLNCKWFLLKEPAIKIMGNVRENTLTEMFKNVRKYRKKCFEGNGDAVHKCETIKYVFGGCGGSPGEIIKLAREHI